MSCSADFLVPFLIFCCRQIQQLTRVNMDVLSYICTEDENRNDAIEDFRVRKRLVNLSFVGNEDVVKVSDDTVQLPALLVSRDHLRMRKRLSEAA